MTRKQTAQDDAHRRRAAMVFQAPPPPTEIGRQLYDFGQMVLGMAYGRGIDADLNMMRIFTARSETLARDWIHAASEINRQERARLDAWRREQQAQPEQQV